MPTNTMTPSPRKYPVGTQIFADVIKEKMVYVDKTDLVWKLAHGPKYTFLSRPRRFGKTLLVSTLHSYFNGDRELFEGLKMMDYETEWKQYPVVRLDMSRAKGQATVELLQNRIKLSLKQYTRIYGADPDELTPGSMLEGIISRASDYGTRKVVVLIDEYDAPLLEVMHAKEHMEAYKEVMKEFYQPLKACEDMIHFCFMTGITKFSQLSIFSTLNNISNVSMDKEYASICGITETELQTEMREDVELLAASNGCSYEEMHAKLKKQYDGYHFCSVSEDIYNPYSLVLCFQKQEIRNYWFESGTPTMLLNQIHKMGPDITRWEQLEAQASAFDAPTEYLDDLTPLLYQSGYLTIKSYERDTDSYLLGIPNQEVRIGMAEGLMALYTGIMLRDVQGGFGIKFYRALRKDDINLALSELKAFLAGVPYINGFKKKLAEVAVKEAFYQYSLYLIFNTLNAFTRTEVAIRTGRIDMVVLMPATTYVFEFKIRQNPEAALRQIEQRRYAEPFETEGRRVVKVGVQFDLESWTILDWKTI